jgi:hypothetical protein
MKMMLMEAHQKLGHVAVSTVKCMVTNGTISRIDIDPLSIKEFYKPCVKAKATWKLFLKESLT